VLRELGPDPVSGGQVVVAAGRFGPYVTDGAHNVTLRVGDQPETVTLERAAELLAEKRAKPPTAKTTRGRAAKTTAKPTAAKRTTARGAQTKRP
jgi:DNA topoisomerase-1